MSCSGADVATATTPAAPAAVAALPEERLPYPIVFADAARQQHKSNNDDDDVNAHTVTLFNALHWLRPVYELAHWLPPQRAGAADDDATVGTAARHDDDDCARERATLSPPSLPPPQSRDADVRVGLQLLPRFARFYDVAEKLVPQHTRPQRVVMSLRVPTPRGPKTITRDKVEGDHRAQHSTPVHATYVTHNSSNNNSSSSMPTASSLGKTTVTNSTAYFSLLPGHNHFLVHYESAARLACFDYVQLDMLRFAYVAVKELLDVYKVYHRDTGVITGLAMRDVRKNNNNNDDSYDGKDDDNNNNVSGSGSKRTSSRTAAAADGDDDKGKAARGAAATAAVVGRGGGNARLHQGTSGNVIVAPSAAALQARREAAQKRFLRAQLEDEATRRWPHTPAHKSCVFVVDEKHACELPAEAAAQLALPPANALTRQKTARKGPRYYLATVELPLLYKKGSSGSGGGVARFVAPRWWPNRADAEAAAAEVALLALQRYDKQNAKAASAIGGGA